MEKLGRRPLLLWPMCVMTVSFVCLTIFLNLMSKPELVVRKPLWHIGVQIINNRYQTWVRLVPTVAAVQHCAELKLWASQCPYSQQELFDLELQLTKLLWRFTGYTKDKTSGTLPFWQWYATGIGFFFFFFSYRTWKGKINVKASKALFSILIVSG